MSERIVLTPREHPERRPTWMERQGLTYWLGYTVHEPRDFAYCVPRRIACRVLGWHNATCAGRRDHRHQYQRGGR